MRRVTGSMGPNNSTTQEPIIFHFITRKRSASSLPLRTWNGLDQPGITTKLPLLAFIRDLENGARG